MPIYLSNVTTSTISVALTGLTDLTMSGRMLQWTLNGQTKQTISIPSNVASSDSRVCPYTFRGLASSTTYKIDGIITLPSGWVGSAGAIDVTTEETAIPSWSWSASNGAASATQTKNAYAVLRGTRGANDFSYLQA